MSQCLQRLADYRIGLAVPSAAAGESPASAFILMLIALAGVVLISGCSVLVAFGRMDWEPGGMYLVIGYALVGIWFIGILLLVKDQSFLSSGLFRFGMIAGVCMLFGFLAGPLLAEKIEIAFKPLIWLAYAGGGAGWLMFPIWCWRVAASLK